jgi:hypothetical protein
VQFRWLAILPGARSLPRGADDLQHAENERGQSQHSDQQKNDAMTASHPGKVIDAGPKSDPFPPGASQQGDQFYLRGSTGAV